MEERDPFGREKDDDPLADMGWASEEAAPPASGPAEIGAPSPDAPAAPQPPPRITPRPSLPIETDWRAPAPGRAVRGCAAAGCILPAAVIVFIVAVAAIVIPRAVDEIGDDVDPILPDPVRPQRDPPQGLARGSLLLHANFAAALRRVERASGARRVRLVRVAPDRIDVQAVVGGRTRLTQTTWDGQTRVIATTPGGGGKTFPWSRVDPAAPQRIASAATRGRRGTSFDYAVLLDAISLTWSAFLKDGTHFTASPDGRNVSRVGG